MDSFHCIAIDMGAASIRIMTGSISDGRLSVSESSRFRNESKLINDHERWDIESIISEIKRSFSLILADSSFKVSSVGVDSWGVDFVLLDKENNLLEIPVAYRDSRTKNMQEKWKSIMPADSTFQKTGINFYEFNTLFQLLSIREDEIIKKTHLILFIPRYIIYRI